MADSTLGWRFPHPDLESAGHTDSLGQTADFVETGVVGPSHKSADELEKTLAALE